jgi:hypothetical protein
MRDRGTLNAFGLRVENSRRGIAPLAVCIRRVRTRSILEDAVMMRACLLRQKFYATDEPEARGCVVSAANSGINSGAYFTKHGGICPTADISISTPRSPPSSCGNLKHSYSIHADLHGYAIVKAVLSMISRNTPRSRNTPDEETEFPSHSSPSFRGNRNLSRRRWNEGGSHIKGIFFTCRPCHNWELFHLSGLFVLIGVSINISCRSGVT